LLAYGRARIVENGQRFNVSALVLLECTAQHGHTAPVDIAERAFGGDVATANASFRYSLNVFPIIAGSDKDRLYAEPFQMGAARLIEGDFPECRFEGERMAPIDVLVNELLHLLSGLLPKLHIQVAARTSVLKASICIWEIGKRDDLPPPDGPATITMRGAGMAGVVTDRPSASHRHRRG